MFYEYGVPPPKVLAYDDGCHLKKFLENRAKEGAKFARWVLSAMAIVVDKCAAAGRPPRAPHRLPHPECPRPCSAPAPSPPHHHGARRRFHWPNHKNNPYCKDNVDPAKCEALTDDMNTEAAEEARAPAPPAPPAPPALPALPAPPASPPHPALLPARSG